MMRDGPEWFAPKRYGFGAGLPIAWQGWALLAGYLVSVAACVFLWGDNAAVVLAILLPLTALLIVISWRTTRGGWRWRWGQDD